MSELFTYMWALTGKLISFFHYLKENDDREKLLAFHSEITKLCKQIFNQEFDEKDDLYLDTIDKIMDTGNVIKAFKENQIELTEVFDHLTDIIDNVKKISGIENEE